MKKIITILLLGITSSIFGQAILGEYQIKNLEINTKFSDFGTSYFGKNKVVFAAPKNGRIIKNLWKGNSQPFLDIYIGEISKDGQIINKKKVKGNVNTKFHEAGIIFTKDLKTVYFTGNNYYKNEIRKDSLGVNNLQLFKADVNYEGEWVNIVKLPFNSDQFSSGHPALSLNEKRLYFISDRPESIGKTDIFFVDILGEEGYSIPMNVSNVINTSKKEMFPFISAKGVLYFSSDGYEDNVGKLDIYASKILENSYSNAVNVKPLNSKEDDFALIIGLNGKGYFSSNRRNGNGDDDIYSFVASQDIEFECNKIVSGIISDAESNALLKGAVVILLDKSKKKEITRTKSGLESAAYSFNVPCNGKYSIKAIYSNYLEESKIVDIPSNFAINSIEVDLALKKEFKILPGKVLVNIEPIYFDYNKYNIRPDALIELDKIVDLMKNHPKIKIEAGSHTDSRASRRYNQILSENRAKSTASYIINKGIGKSRIIYRGYGESQLINHCSDDKKCSKEEHQLNRRTEFKVINK